MQAKLQSSLGGDNGKYLLAKDIDNAQQFVYISYGDDDLCRIDNHSLDIKEQLLVYTFPN